jgi:hypothetical protein
MYRRMAVLASLAVMATMFVGSSTASAASGDTFACVFTGVAGNLVDNQNGAAGIPSIQKDLTNPAYQTAADPRDIEVGTYNYSGEATCAGTINGLTLTSAPNNADIVSAGVYNNELCGTGWALDDGQPSQTTVTADVVTPPGGRTTADNIGYEIRFLGGNGPLEIGDKAASGAPNHTGSISSDYTGSGAVHIQPKGGNCANSDVNAFDVSGSFEAEED